MNPLQTTIFFGITSIIYFIIKFMFCENYNAKEEGGKKLLCNIIRGLYLLIFCFAILLPANIKNAKNKCGENNFDMQKVMMYTIGPNLIIFCGLILVLNVFPGWKSPFSNTLGYLLVNVLGKVFLNKTSSSALLDILKNPGNNKLLRRVYKNPAMMINEITPGNFDLFINKLRSEQSVLKEGVTKGQLSTLYNLVVIKDNIASFIWYILTGILVIQNSQAYINSIKCNRNEELLKELVKEEEEKTKKQLKDKKEKNISWVTGEI